MGPTWVLSAPCRPHKPCYHGGHNREEKPVIFWCVQFKMTALWTSLPHISKFHMPFPYATIWKPVDFHNKNKKFFFSSFLDTRISTSLVKSQHKFTQRTWLQEQNYLKDHFLLINPHYWFFYFFYLFLFIIIILVVVILLFLLFIIIFIYLFIYFILFIFWRGVPWSTITCLWIFHSDFCIDFM